ncbi:PKD domain-containing protein [Roseateles sp. BYS78W]|uniref:PKD domain-containing protein n=1 Tax=Pelomonas candidula TaxID=3299025 RepID=A0ABW7HLD0_9BURK
MQGWGSSFGLGKRFAVLGLMLAAVVAQPVASAAGVSGGVGTIGEETLTSLTLSTSATTVSRSSSVAITAAVRPGASGTVTFGANGSDLGTVIVEVANAPDACPPPGDDAKNLTTSSTTTAAGCESNSVASVVLTVPPNSLPTGVVLIKASFSSNDPAYSASTAELSLTVIGDSAQKIAFVTMPRADGYDSSWKTFAPTVSSGFNATRFEWDFDGDGVVDVVDVTGTVQVWRYPRAGNYTATLVVRDASGTSLSATQVVNVPNPPPVISGYSPSVEANLSVGAKPAIGASYSDPLGVDTRSVRLVVDGADVTALANVTATAISYTPAAAFAAGSHSVLVTAFNSAGSVAQATWDFSVAAARTYTVNVISPSGPTVVNPSLSVVVDVGSNQGHANSVTLNGAQMSAVDGALLAGGQRYQAQVALADGQNTLLVEAAFDDGQTRSTSVAIEYDAPPRVTIITPVDKAVFGRALASSPGNLTGNVDRPITVTGSLARPVSSVSINQQQAQLDSSGLSFSFPNFFLHEGSNLLNVVATDARGRTGSASLSLYVDQTAPILSVESPRPGAITRAGWIDVRGMVNDAVEAGVGSAEPQVLVSVNGQPEQAAVVADRYFQLNRLVLGQGLNRISVRAVDSLGNERSQTLDLYHVNTGLAGLVLVDGHDQTAPGRAELPKPLVVLALDANGEPVPNQSVDFIVERGTGSLSPTQGQSASGNSAYTARAISVATDSQGKASAWFTVGKQSGPAANLVRAVAGGLGGESVLFVASSLRGDPARVTADLGINQIGETEAQVMELLSAVVRDSGDNYLPGVRVQFRVEEGKAMFVDSSGGTVAPDGQSIVVFTDKNGVAAVRPRLGSQPGVVRISVQAAKSAAADFSDPVGVVAGGGFVIRAKQSGEGPTTFSGFIYSDKGQPLQGAKVSIGRTALLATSDDKGYFEIANVPAGRIDLFVDGRAVNPGNDPTRPQWPSLHFEAYAVRGQRNELPHAIYLPALLTSEAKVVGGNEDVVLTIPGLEGFRMTVKANSVTFPDGSHTGTLVVSPVTADKLPMAPPAGGAQFGVPAWTIQPAGTRFDPPVEVRMPNSTNEQPGDNLPVVQWDHDLGQYVPMGRATVSSDGAWLTTDSGSGVTKAGWGGVCRYDNCKTAATKCPDCMKMSAQGSSQCPNCAPDRTQDDKPCNGDACMRCRGGSCIEKFSKNTKAIDSLFVDVQQEYLPSIPGGNLGLFNGFKSSPGKPAIWDIDVNPQCSSDGSWKFKISKAFISSYVLIAVNHEYLELNDAELSKLAGGANVCRALNHAEYSLRSSASSHYPEGSRSNPDVALLLGLSWKDPNAPVYDLLAGIIAHEGEHYTRFKKYVSDPWERFKLVIGQLQTPILDGDDVASAKARMQQRVDDEILKMHQATKDAQILQAGYYDHGNPETFYARSVGAMSRTLRLLYQARAANGCVKSPFDK